MKRIVYLNGEFIPPEQAQVSIFDRGVLFGDAVYEVAGVIDGKLLDFHSHMARLSRSLGELNIPQPLDSTELLSIFRKMIQLNNLEEGLVYMQVTRGPEERDFIYSEILSPTVFMFTQEKPSLENEYAKTGVSLKSVEDIRWARRDIKSVNLLGQVLAKQTAHDHGAYEALMIGPDGMITECGATSFFIIKDNTIITRPLSNDILPGVTRSALIELCDSGEIMLDQRSVSLEEVYVADEAFISGASSYVLPVTSVDDKTIGSGTPGNITNKLRGIYIEFARSTAI